MTDEPKRKTRWVTDATGFSIEVEEPSEETKKVIKRIVEEHGEALIRLSKR